MRIFYRYPVREFLGMSNPTAPQALEGACLEEQQSTITPEVAASVFEIAPYLAPRPIYHPPPVPVNQRDVEIYRLHIDENAQFPHWSRSMG